MYVRLSVDNVAGMLGSLGDFLTGLAALLAVILTWFQGRKELDRWRQQKRIEKRAEVAGQVMGAAIRALGAIDYIATPGRFGAVSDPVADESSSAWAAKDQERSELLLELEGRWKAAEPEMRAMIDATDLAHTFLPSEAADLMEEIQALVASVRAHQVTWTMRGTYGHPKAAPVYTKALGAVPRNAALELRAKVMSVLRPLAQDDTDAKQS